MRISVKKDFANALKILDTPKCFKDQCLTKLPFVLNFGEPEVASLVPVQIPLDTAEIRPALRSLVARDASSLMQAPVYALLAKR